MGLVRSSPSSLPSRAKIRGLGFSTPSSMVLWSWLLVGVSGEALGGIGSWVDGDVSSV